MNQFTLDMIDTNTRQGRILLMAIAHITTTTHQDATPDDVLYELERRYNLTQGAKSDGA